MKWKQLVSMTAAAAAVAGITVVSKLLMPLEPIWTQAGIAGFVGAIVHKINIWGGNSETK